MVHYVLQSDRVGHGLLRCPCGSCHVDANNAARLIEDGGVVAKQCFIDAALRDVLRVDADRGPGQLIERHSWFGVADDSILRGERG